MNVKLACLLLCGAVLSGCVQHGSKEELPTDTYELYFQEQDLTAASGGALRAERTPILEGEESESTLRRAKLLMKDLLDGPRDETLKSVVPAGTTLLSMELLGTCAVVDLSANYGILSGVALTLADQAIALTLTQLPDILSVKITVQGQELAYRDKQVFTGQNVWLAPEGDVVSSVDVTLFFLGEEGRLVGEPRTLELYEGDTQVSAVAKAMESGPADKQHRAVFPAGFRVKSVWLEDDMCYVNLSSGLLESMDTTKLNTALQALGRSLCSLETVRETWYLVDGEFADSYGGVCVEEPYTDEV